MTIGTKLTKINFSPGTRVAHIAHPERHGTVVAETPGRCGDKEVPVQFDQRPPKGKTRFPKPGVAVIDIDNLKLV